MTIIDITVLVRIYKIFSLITDEKWVWDITEEDYIMQNMGW